MGELSIKVTIGNRVYPLTVDTAEEEHVRKAAQMITEKVKNFEQNFAVKDKQDLLAMAALDFATEKLRLEAEGVVEDSDVKTRLTALNDKISDYLE